MGARDLNKVAITMGQMLKILPELEERGKDFFAIDDYKEEYYVLAYMARVGILDIIEVNSYMNNPFLPITIPLGIFRTRKETLQTAMDITVGKLKELADGHYGVYYTVNNILERGEYFAAFERAFPELKSKFS